MSSPEPRHVAFTYEDYLLFPDDGRPHEIIDGEHYMPPAPGPKHQRVSQRLATAIANFLRHHRIGEILTAPIDLVLSDVDVVQSDLLFITAARAAMTTEKHIRGAPDLVVEIVSETTRKTDEIIKRKLYERYGVAEHWIVDPELETGKVYRMTDQGYVCAAELSQERGDTLTTPLMPDFQLPLVEIFE